MSWPKKRGQNATPSQVPEGQHLEPVQMYNPNQANQWQPSSWYQQSQNVPVQTYQQNSQNNWEQSGYTDQQNQQVYNQHSQHYQSQYGNSQLQPEQQSLGNVQYNQQYNTQNNTFQPGSHQNSEVDTWGNWGWGDEDNSNVQNILESKEQTKQPAMTDLTSSFTNDESWNWTVEEPSREPLVAKDPVDLFPTMAKLGGVGGGGDQGEISSNLTRKPNKLETPQWSIDSQISQESSDDILQTSESDNHLISSSSPSALENLKTEDNHLENREVIKKSSAKYPDDSWNRAVNLPQKNTTGLVTGTRQNFYQPTTSQTVNLETLPDNSEHPDIPEKKYNAGISQRFNQHQNWQQDNNSEICMNDRNQYLETGQLSDANQPVFEQDTEIEAIQDERSLQEDTLPPPGLRRMVLGQNEINPPNFQNNEISFEPISPPEGLRRMVPGESSSPENSLRQATMFQSENVTRVENSDMEFNRMPQLRSATIGADMPSVVSQSSTAQSNIAATNRSETIGAPMNSNRGTSASPVNPKKSLNRKPIDTKSESQRRDFIEGESELSSGMRNLTVGENSTDEIEEMRPSSENRRKLSHQETSESENDRKEKLRDKKDKRYKSDRRARDEYSPDRRYERKKYRDRHYDDTADYFSDGEQEKPHREHDRKYYSLKKDKERDRRRRESPREYEKDRRKRDDYYHRYEDSFENEERSRPSSRSDSMHNSSSYNRERDRRMEKEQRRRDRPRDRDKHRRPRDPYNPYGYNYDPYNPYYQQYQYQYYENLARTNPQAYAEIYRKYYEQQSQRHPAGYGHDDRSSVHSGRSSANEEQKDSNSRPTKDQLDSYIFEDTKMGRVTPAKFTTAHMKVSINSGKLVKILPNYPQDGQPAVVELIRMENNLQKDDEFKELAAYPGPLNKDVTHKKTVIEYCENKIRNVSSNFDISDPDSYILLWELLILLLRQNGKVVGTDIAELLLKNRETRPPSGLSNLSGTTGDIPPVSECSNPQLSETFGGGNSISNLKEEEITNKFREYLLYGSGQEALEWAMKHGLWGHALFLASKLGKRTYSNVMVRFANGLTINDPLQTLYQLLSGRMPAAVTGVADEKWGDWKPHLAMILSNSSLQPELNRKAITALGDTLITRGSLYAAQFCYLMAEVGFERYGSETAKVVLLGSDHSKPFTHFARNEAIHMTEIYEYACSLNNPDFALPELQAYKYLLATRLADRGFLEKSLAYLEKIALYIISNPTSVQSSLINNVCNLADRLKYYDPVSVEYEDENLEIDADNRLDSSWLKSLKTLKNDLSAGLIQSEVYSNNDITLTNPIRDIYSEDSMQQSQQIYQYHDDSTQQWQPEQSPLNAPIEPFQQNIQQLEGYSSLPYEDQQQQQQQQQQYWSNQQQQWNTSDKNGAESSVREQQTHYGSINTQNEEEGKPAISIPNQSKGKSYFDDEPLPHEKVQQNKTPPSKPEINKEKPKQNSSGWFGGIFSKLALKPKNQVKLPDDKNPSIVWDQEKKRWVNLDEDNNTSSNEIKPPPTVSEMKPISAKPPLPQLMNNNNPINQSQNFSHTPNESMSMMNTDNSQSNMFKLQRNRNLKKSYVDVFNPGGGVSKPTVAPPTAVPALSNVGQPQMNFFVPQPINDPNAPTNFLTQANPIIQPHHDESAQLSRWSSASSLSKEVQYYMQQKPHRTKR